MNNAKLQEVYSDLTLYVQVHILMFLLFLIIHFVLGTLPPINFSSSPKLVMNLW